jgi:rsbT co-antagonist protein RsbR
MITDVFEKHHEQLLNDWLDRQVAARGGRTDQYDPEETRDLSKRFIDAMRNSLAISHSRDITATEWSGVREILEEVSRTRAARGASAVQTATFVFSLKEPLFASLRREIGKDADKLANEVWAATELLDRLGLFTTEVSLKAREAMIARQQEEMLELSTPVVELWDGILALPLIGTLDSERTQIVMENLLERIVSSEAEIAIIDITGVPTVDTLVAQHLLKTISAARLMGADCIISGIRPQIAQTIVHLGVSLDVISKATMADAFRLALRRTGKAVVEGTVPRSQGAKDIHD